ncbi:50S ribosomal protein L4 [Planctomycetota bacterium]
MYQLKIRSVDAGTLTEVGVCEVDPEVLGGKVRTRLVHEACIMYAANKRLGTHKTKVRSEVNASNRKPWRQKGTGRARAGSRRSPIWRGGGTIFGPRPRDYSYSIPKKARWRATQSALHSKLRDAETTVVNAIPATGKTRDVAAFLKALGVKGRMLVVTASHDDMVARGARNIPYVDVVAVSDLNSYDLIRQKWLIITKEALDKAVATWGASSRVGKPAEEAPADEALADEAPAEEAPAEEAPAEEAPAEEAPAGESAEETPAGKAAEEA